MTDNTIDINSAIAEYNRKRPKETPKMTQQTLGELVFAGTKTPKVAGWYLSLWQIGKETTKLHPEHIRAICKHTGTTPNQLFNIQ